jgi:hypothetical protein
MTYNCRTFAIAVLMAAAVSVTGAAREERLRVHVYPSFAQAPALVRIQAMIAPAAENRVLEFVADSGNYYRSSTIELSGAESPRAYTVEFRSVPEGVYQVQVVLRDGDSRVRATLYYRVVVVGRDDV